MCLKDELEDEYCYISALQLKGRTRDGLRHIIWKRRLEVRHNTTVENLKFISVSLVWNLFRGQSLQPLCALSSQIPPRLSTYSRHSRKLIKNIDPCRGTSGIKTSEANSLSCLGCLRADEDNREKERVRTRERGWISERIRWWMSDLA